jgi:hypothetical protein
MKLVAGTLASLALLASATPIDSSSSSSNKGSAETTTTTAANITSHVRNANHIFNSLHSSMRQWGSSWHHNGMSFYLASVPEGTQFYHGTRSEYRVNGTEWLAFEPEHALNFARVSHGKGRGPGGPGGGPPGGGPPPLPMRKEIMKKGKQEILHDSAADKAGVEEEAEEWGYLHTYVTNKDLRLLYIDGLSAGKTDMGTTDSGDRIFLRDQDLSLPEKDPSHSSGPGGEYARAVLGCDIAKNEWNDRIDGILRAEAGFEIILCDFARDLDVVRINAAKKEDDSFPPAGFGNSGYFYRAIAARFDGIGGERVHVNYDNFVTAFTYEDLDLFNGGENEMPRLDQFSADELQPIRDDLTRFVLEHDIAEPSFNWQSIVDMIVTKYSNLLMFYASDEIDSLRSLQGNITTLFLSFIDGRVRDAAAETERCAAQFTSPSNHLAPRQKVNANTLAADVVYDVSYSICSALRSVLDDTDFAVAKARITGLVEYLAWTTWKECKTKCGYNQACFIPIWPFGTVEDRLNPQCKDGTDDPRGGSGERYWRGGFGPGKPREDGHEEL